MAKWLVAIIVILLSVVGILWQHNRTVNEDWKRAEANVKAYSVQFGKEQQKNTALQLTIDQFGYFKDSILEELNATRRELKIKDSNLKSLQRIASSFSRTDTLIISQVDTLFKEPDLHVDTILGDEWYQLRLGLKYPSTIAVKPHFKSVKHVVVSSKKETVNPPKKFFLFRWFQKKQRVIHVDVIEKNPYAENETSRYVEIIK